MRRLLTFFWRQSSLHLPLLTHSLIINLFFVQNMAPIQKHFIAVGFLCRRLELHSAWSITVSFILAQWSRHRIYWRSDGERYCWTNSGFKFYHPYLFGRRVSLVHWEANGKRVFQMRKPAQSFTLGHQLLSSGVSTCARALSWRSQDLACARGQDTLSHLFHPWAGM